MVRYALNSGPGLNIPAWAVYIALAHFSDDHGLSERTHREIADAIDAGSVSTVKVAIQHLEYFGKVEVTRRPGSTGGRNLPNVYRITGEEFDWQPTPKEPREPGQIFAAYRRRHAEIEAEHRRSYEALEQSHRQREQDLLRRIGELEAAVNGHAPRHGEDATLPMNDPPGSREAAILPEPAPQPSPTLPRLPESLGNEPPYPSDDNPPGVTAELPEAHGPGAGQPGNGYRSGPVPSRGRTGRRGRGRPADARVLALDQGQMGRHQQRHPLVQAEPRRMDTAAEERQGGQGGRGTQAGQARETGRTGIARDTNRDTNREGRKQRESRSGTAAYRRTPTPGRCGPRCWQTCSCSCPARPSKHG